MDDQVLVELPTYESLRCAIYTEKRKLQPVLASRASDITLNPPYSKTLDGRYFLLFNYSSEVGQFSCFPTAEVLLSFPNPRKPSLTGLFFCLIKF